MEKYLEYYWLEEYLEKKVRPNFEENHFLAVEEFFFIIEWKVPRFGKIHVEYLKEGNQVEKLTRNIYAAESDKDRLKILLKEESGERRRGIKLAMASAILTTLYPDRFTVYDIRVRKQLRTRGRWNEKPDDITDRPDVIDRYFDKYLSAVQAVKKENGMSLLRDCDRALWAQDWREDLQTFITK